jgi:hypothetical protein
LGIQQTGISTGQEDVLGLNSNITSTFLPQEQQGRSNLEDILSLIIGPITTIIGGLLPTGRAGEAPLEGGAGMLLNRMQSIFGDSSQPYVQFLEIGFTATSELTELRNNPLADAPSANVYITRYSENARNDLQIGRQMLLLASKT